MITQEIKISFQDAYGNNLGTLIITYSNKHIEEYETFSKMINGNYIEFKNVPRVFKTNQNTAIAFNENKCVHESILLLEETEYQLFFTPANINIENISFPTLEKKDKTPVFKKLNINRADIYSGILNFKAYAGKSFFDVQIDKNVSLKCPFEVRSKKIDYINHYSSMISDLSQAASSIILYDKSPVHSLLNFEERVKKSFYEDFMFLEYIFRPENLPTSYGHIRRDPHRILIKYTETVPISLASSVGPSSLIDIVACPENLTKTDEVPFNWPAEMKNLVPQKVAKESYIDNLDTPENRFIKYFLTLLFELISEMNLYIEKEGINGYPAEKIIEYQEIIQEYVMDEWVDEVGKLDHFPSNSQVLQKKEGYREIFDYFLIFEFSFNFQFEEVKEEIKGYQKKLSELYEYWCYLKLIKIMSKLSRVKVNYSSIFDLNRKKWSIKVKRGEESSQKFIIPLNDMDLEVELEFNREFKKYELNYNPYPLKYRPDYTIIVKTSYYKVFLHFDAKYKLNKETFKNEDIFKMHTYKDAIKYSSGAYVLYPGLKEGIYYENEKTVASVGAFPLKPGKLDIEDENKIETFLIKFLNLISEESEDNIK